jgi:hypothetical protein
MRGSMKALLVCGALVTAAFGAAGLASAALAPSAAVAQSASCIPTVSNIDWGRIDGRATIMFTAQVECNYGAPSIYLHTVIYNCGGQRPEDNRKFLLANCAYGTNDQTFTPVEGGVTYTLTGPGSTEVFTAPGNYASQFSFIINGSDNGPFFGTPAKCGSSSCTNIQPAS